MSLTQQQIQSGGDPFDEAGFDTQYNRISQAYNTAFAKNTLQQGIADTNHQDQYAKLRLQNQRTQGQFQGGFAQRGIQDSGLYGEAVMNRQQDFNTAKTDLDRNYLLHKAGLFGEATANENARSALNDVQLMRQARRDSLAADF